MVEHHGEYEVQGKVEFVLNMGTRKCEMRY
jgi:hypothetical protein